MRRAISVVIEPLLSPLSSANGTTKVAMAIKARKVGRGDIDSYPMSRLESIGGRPHVYLQAINATRLKRQRALLNASKSSTQHSILQLNGATVWEHIAQTPRKVRIDSA